MSASSSADRTPFIHPQALCESARIGAGTRVWAFAHVLPGAAIGEDCNICDHVFIENDVVIGDRVTVKCGVQLWDGLTVGDEVFIGPNATFSNDRFPRSKQYQKKVETTTIGRGASIGAGAVILPGLKIGARAMVGAGAVVTHDVPPRAIVSGNPARIVGYADTRTAERPALAAAKAAATPRVLSVAGVTLRQMPLIEDLRGKLTVAEGGKDFPFTVQRCFVVFDVPGKDVRGEHAHRECHQFLVCIRGAVSVVVDDGKASEEVRLDSPNLGLHVPPMVWAVQYKYSSDAALMVLASHHYDAADYIRDYDEFLSLRGAS